VTATSPTATSRTENEKPGRKARLAIRMMTNSPAKDPKQQRRAVMRTVWLLAAAAVGSYAVFLWTAMHPK
jgi:cytoskeletal protein RodZ